MARKTRKRGGGHCQSTPGSRCKNTTNNSKTRDLIKLIEDGSSYDRIEEAIKGISKEGLNRSVHGKTPLITAVISEGRDIIPLLIKHGASPNKRGDNGRTALHIAAERSNLAAIQELENSGINVNTKDKDGLTALMIAFSTDDGEECVNGLLEYRDIEPYGGTLDIPKSGVDLDGIQTGDDIGDDIDPGDEMVDFNGEARFGRYYTKYFFDRLPEPKRTPSTRKPIRHVIHYRVGKIVAPRNTV